MEREVWTIRRASARPSMISPLMASVALAWLAFMIPSLAAAQYQYDRAAFEALMPANSEETIPVGTKINVTNWEKYKRFMPIGMQALFSGKYHWKMTTAPEYTIEIGPTVLPIPAPKKFVQDTEKYGGQATLKPVEGGSFTLENYKVGLPFPNPKEPNLPYKIIYNAWFYFRPFLYTYTSNVTRVDQGLNLYYQTGGVQNWRLSHLSDEGYPEQMDYAGPYFLNIRNPQFSPEQNKYLVSLKLLYGDPEKIEESYVFLPTLRRALRLSAASRCAPALGTDWVNDDNGGGQYFHVPNFKIEYLGEKKVIALVRKHDCPGGDKTKCYVQAGSVPGWPRQMVGPWQIVPVYVLDVTPMPSMGNYCYQHKILYTTHTDAYVQVWFDVFDRSDKLWKINKLSWQPLRLPDGQETEIAGIDDATVWDVQNSHATMSLYTDLKIDNENDAELLNGKVWAFPGGLSRVMR